MIKFNRKTYVIKNLESTLSDLQKQVDKAMKNIGLGPEFGETESSCYKFYKDFCSEEQQFEIANIVSRWSRIIEESKKTEFVYEIYPDHISFNQAAFLLLGLECSQLEHQRQYFFEEDPELCSSIIGTSIEDYIKHSKPVAFLLAYFKTKEINTGVFLNWAVEKKFLEVINNPQRIISNDIAKALFKKLKYHKFIKDNDVFDGSWAWIGKKKEWAWLANELCSKGIITKSKFVDLCAYIPIKTNASVALNDAGGTPSQNTRLITDIVKSIE